MTAVISLSRGPFTRQDLAAMPDDGHRYELLDGTLLVSPAPAFAHQLAVVRLWRLIDDGRSADSIALVAPFDVVLSDVTVFEPDVLLAPTAAFTRGDLPGPPTLAVEVLSPSSRSIDRVLKHNRYAEAGIEHYWIIDPDEPSITAYRLGAHGQYAQVAHVVGDEPFETTDPVVVRVVPSELVAVR
jgi:Uma2 family endonuclease